MPELPEVETIRRGLAACLVGARITSVKVLRASVVVGPVARFANQLRGREFVGFRRHGKLLIIDLSGGVSLLVHLRMTGQLLLPVGHERPEHTRVVFHVQGRKEASSLFSSLLVYADCRALGTLEVARNATLARMGPDALSPEGPEHLGASLSGRRAPIKCVLLDQSVMAGIGNIYASEILHAARIAPDRPANTLSPAERRRLRVQTRRILQAAVAAGGTTLLDGRYCDPVGTPGGYRKRLRVYGRAGERCLRRGCGGTVERLVQHNRSTFWCRGCQE